jgi:carbon-monoxide dehydrogenase large subunit
MLERMLDRASRKLELEPLEVRRINLRREPRGEAAAEGATDRPRLEAVVDSLVELSDMESLRKMRRQRRAAGELFGVGVALSLLSVTGGSTGRWRQEGWESARIRVGPAGDVEVFTGASSPGPGLETAYSEIVAAVLGVPPADIRVHRGDTASCPTGTGSPGGRTVPVGGSALLQAARMVQRRMRTVAAHLLGVGEDYVDQIGSTFLAGEKSVALEEVSREAYRPVSLPGDIPPGLEVTCCHRETTPTRSACGHVCAVSVDPETGTVEVEGYFSVGDFGRVLHVPGVRTRIHGAATRAVERALLSQPEHGDGYEVSSGTLAPAMPRADQLPDLVWGRTETPAAVNLLQARGVGEAGSAGALPAVVNAVLDALADHGVVHLDVPLTPERIWRSLRQEPGEESSEK